MRVTPIVLCVSLFVTALTPRIVSQTPVHTSRLDTNLKEVRTEKETIYYREANQREDGTYGVRINYRNGLLKMLGQYQDEKLSVETGHFEFYFANGVKESEGMYSSGFKIGTWKRWDYEGNPRPDRVYPDEIADRTLPVTIPAQFPGGDSALAAYVEENLVYPEAAIKQVIQGVVYVAFQINVEGHIQQVDVIEGANYYLDREAVRMIHAMPAWLPATRNGEPRDSQFILPITFNLEHYAVQKSNPANPAK